MKTFRGILFGVLFSVIGFWAPLYLMAQEKPAPPKLAVTVIVPVFPELDSLKLANAVLERNNLALQIQQAQVELEKLNAALKTLVESHQKPGFDLVQGADKKFAYQVKPPEAQR